MIYLDTFALVKLVATEAESPALRRYLGTRSDKRWFTAALTRTELIRAVSGNVSVLICGMDETVALEGRRGGANFPAGFAKQADPFCRRAPGPHAGLIKQGSQVVWRDKIAVGIKPAVEEGDDALVIDPWE